MKLEREILFRRKLLSSNVIHKKLSQQNKIYVHLPFKFKTDKFKLEQHSRRVRLSRKEEELDK